MKQRSFGAVVIVFASLVLIFYSYIAYAENGVIVTHALAMHGTPKYGPDFKHFDYVNPDATKGGDVRMWYIGTFDNLNPFILKGVAAAGLGMMYDTLLVESDDEAFTEYGLLVENIEMPEDRSWVMFTLRKEARWHDGAPITAEDVIFSLKTLKSKGHPFYQAYYENVKDVEKFGERKVKFIFSEGENRELPLIIGQLPIIPKHYWEERDFEKTTLEIPLGSGPYKIESFEPGRFISYTRVKDYWAKDLPINKGRYNFDGIQYDYYRDSTVSLQAFKAGEYDFRHETTSKDWATAYDIPAVKNGLIRMEEIPHENPAGMQCFVFNIRRTFFKDPRVRLALTYLFDFEWSNRNLFYGQYTRTRSYFSNSELASRGLPSPEEIKILAPFRGKIPDEVFTKEYNPPETDGSGQIREHLKEAFNLLKEAGWVVRDNQLINTETGEPLSFEILLDNPVYERIVLPYVKNLERLGIQTRVRTVDSAQYEKRIETFDFDMTVDLFPQSLSPGNEQRDFWSSAAADEPGSRNTIGIKDPVVDELIDLIISAPDRESLIYRCRALDRVLLWGHYVIPHWHSRNYKVAYWDKFSRPEISPKYSLGFECWWINERKEKALQGKKTSMGEK